MTQTHEKQNGIHPLVNNGESISIVNPNEVFRHKFHELREAYFQGDAQKISDLRAWFANNLEKNK